MVGRSRRRAARNASTGWRKAASPLRPVECRDFLFDPCPKGLHVRAMLVPFRAHEVIGASGTQTQRERDHQPSGAQLVVSQHVMGEQNAGTFKRRVERMIGAVETKPAADVCIL